MSYNGSGTFVINTSGQPVVTGTVISSTAFNALTADLGTGLSTAITKDGQTITTAKIPFAQGMSADVASNFAAGTVAAPAIYLSTDTGTGLYRIGANNDGFAISGTKLLDFGSALLGITGAATISTTLGVTGITTLGAAIVGPASATVFNTVSTTVNAFGAATTLNMGAATGTLTVANTTLAAKAITASTTLGVTGVSTLTAGAVIQGMTVGLGAGAVSTNTAVGYQAAYSITTGPQNIAVGYQAGYSTTTGAENTAIGQQASFSSTTGDKITSIGRGAMYSTTTGDGTAIGVYALYSQTTALGNVAVGGQSTSNDSALKNVTTGSYNIGVGIGAGTALTTGGSNVYLGVYAAASAGGVSNEIVMGYNITGKGANTGFISPNSGGVYQGNNSSSWSVTSDQRLKKNIVDNNVGLEKITAIQVRNFEYRLPEEVDAELKHTDAIQNEGVQLGVIAQELQLVLPECVKTESTGVMSVNADNLTWYLVNAIKELDAKFEAYKSTHP